MKAILALAAIGLALSGPLQKSSSAASPAPVAAYAGDKLFDLTRVHRLRIAITASEWAVLMGSGGRGTGPGGSDYQLPDGRMVHLSSGFANVLPWAHADLRIDDAGGKAEFKDIGIRYKGNSSFTRSSISAPLLANFKLKIDQHGAKGTWDGERTLNLQSGVVDASRMKDATAYWVFRTAGVPAPRTTYAEVIFNVPGVYQDTSAGLFTIIEDVNPKFLERVFPPGKGLLMKPEALGGGIHALGDSWAQYVPKMRPDRDATAHEQLRVMEFAALVSQNDVDLFRSKIGTYLDVDEFLRFIAVNAFIANTDSYLNGSHNFYLYLDPTDDRFRFVPWDQDLSLNARAAMFLVRADGTTLNNAAPPSTLTGPDLLKPANANQLLIYWLLDDPAVAARYRAIIRELASTAFSPAELTKLMDALEAVSQAPVSSPRSFVLARAQMVQELVAAWK